MSHTPQPTREPVTKCKALCTCHPLLIGYSQRCENNAMPGRELCWTHCHAIANPNRSRPLEMVP